MAAVAGEAAERHPAVLEGAEILRGGGLVAFPTETVYGLGADATSGSAVERIFEVKGRPADNPVIVHLAELADVERVGRLGGRGERRLLRRFWPGPLTVVIPAREPVRSAACRGLPTVAVRLPAHPVAAALIRAAGCPVAAPSANLSGRPSPTTAAHVLEDLGGRIPLILDGGPCDVGIESTVLDLSGGEPVILRPGAVGASEIAAELGVAVASGADAAAVRSPGTRYRHYRPRAPVVILGLDVPPAAAERLLDALRERLRDRPPIGYVATRSPRRESAGLEILDRSGAGALTRKLYADLRRLDRRGAPLIFVEAVAAEEPVMDRLERASRAVLTGTDLAEAQLIHRMLSLVEGRR